MRRPGRRLVGWLAGGIVGLAVGLPAALLPGHVEKTPTSTAEAGEAVRLGPGGQGPGDYLRQIADQVRATHVYLTPEARVQIDATELEQVRRTAATAAVPVYLAWLPDSDVADSPGWRTPYDALDQLEGSVAEKGYYVVMEHQTLSYLGAVGYRDPYVDNELLLGRPGKALNRFVEALGQVPPEPPYDELPADPDDGYWGGPFSASAAGLLLGGGSFVGLLAVVALTGVLVRRRR